MPTAKIAKFTKKAFGIVVPSKVLTSSTRIRPKPNVRAEHREGKHDLAFEWLEEAYRLRDEFLALLGIDPRLNNLRGDPRFDDLMKRVGLRN